MCEYLKRKTPKRWCLDMVLANYRKGTEYDIDEIRATEYSKEYGITIYTDNEMIPWHCEIKSRVGFGKPLRMKDITIMGERLL